MWMKTSSHLLQSQAWFSLKQSYPRWPFEIGCYKVLPVPWGVGTSTKSIRLSMHREQQSSLSLYIPGHALCTRCTIYCCNEYQKCPTQDYCWVGLLHSMILCLVTVCDQRATSLLTFSIYYHLLVCLLPEFCGSHPFFFVQLWLPLKM